jgi:hypothetical protein
MSCAICEKRPPKRYCPAKGEKICAICCGEEREVSIDCPPDCSYLLAAHRYEAEHRKSTPPEEFPYRDIKIPEQFVYQRWPVVTGLATAILGFQIQHKELHDVATYAAIEALAETYRTLGTGIYYERPPDAPLAHALYAKITEFLLEFRKGGYGRPESPALRDADIFQILVFLLRVAKNQTNGRPRSRAFLNFLRAQFPLPAEAPKDAARIIIP